ncbi:DMT family transporter [Ensifer soli]|uniref:DMT family transporter n=1 Tax=Ciceribacter sp. sgz301302 TaxID=3342379 RepID=UPI0035BAB7CB
MPTSANLRGALFMCLAMAGFTLNDALVKSVSGAMNAGQIMFVRGLLTTLLVFLIARHMGALRPLSVLALPAVALRIAAEVIASVSYIYALGRIPLANASAILQALPLAVTLGAALFLKEPVGWRRWLAILAGFAGVLVVLRPGPDGFGFAALAAILSVVFAATRDLCTRRIPLEIPSLLISAVTAAVITLAGGLLIMPLGGWQPVGAAELGHLAVASVLLLLGYQCIVMAMRTGEISLIAPFRYTSLIWSIGIGMLVFAELPDRTMVVGIAIIVTSGLYTFHRERRRGATPVARVSSPGSPK